MFLVEIVLEGKATVIQLNKYADMFNPIAFREAKIVYNFGLSECNRVNNPCK